MHRKEIAAGRGEKPSNTRWSEPVLVEYEFRYGAKQREAVARLGFPRLDESNPGEWICPFQIHGLKDDLLRWARSRDGLLSLTIASSFIRSSLDRLKDVSSDVVPYWVVFPRQVPFCYGPEFHWRLCKILDTEIKKMSTQLDKQRLARRKSSKGQT
jgi:hypothetical protein